MENRQKVKSSVIEEVRHAKVLEIKFASGGIYQYVDVPNGIFEEFMASDSKGEYYNLHIKDMYECNKLN